MARIQIYIPQWLDDKLTELFGKDGTKVWCRSVILDFARKKFGDFPLDMRTKKKSNGV